jgi:hypothetical protein
VSRCQVRFGCCRAAGNLAGDVQATFSNWGLPDPREPKTDFGVRKPVGVVSGMPVGNSFKVGDTIDLQRQVVRAEVELLAHDSNKNPKLLKRRPP